VSANPKKPTAALPAPGAAAAAAAAAAPTAAIAGIRTEIDPHLVITSYIAPEELTKTPEEFIAAVPVMEVDADRVACNGGDTGLGHPVEYIQLNKVDLNEPATCKYCGLRFIRAHGHGAGHAHAAHH